VKENYSGLKTYTVAFKENKIIYNQKLENHRPKCNMYDSRLHSKQRKTQLDSDMKTD
jgi:hypothetical protein